MVPGEAWQEKFGGGEDLADVVAALPENTGRADASSGWGQKMVLPKGTCTHRGASAPAYSTQTHQLGPENMSPIHPDQGLSSLTCPSIMSCHGHQVLSGSS